MYSGHMLDQLVELVARVEENAREIRVSEPEPERAEVYSSAFLYEVPSRQILVGVA